MSPRTDYTPAALTDPAAKARTRNMALEAVQGSSFLWDTSTNTLRVDWLELAGVDAPTCALLEAKGALRGSGRFIGVDRDAEVLARCRGLYPRQCWVESELVTAISGTGMERVGVVVHDSLRSIHGRPIRRELHALDLFARRQQARWGECLVVVNVGGQENRVTPGIVSDYCAFLSQTVGYTIAPADLHVYTSKTTPMYWTTLRYGFI